MSGSVFSACQFKTKSFFLLHCCPPSEVGFRALLSQGMQEVLLQLVLRNDSDEMCGCVISDPIAPVLFSHFPCLHTPPTCSPSPSGLPVPPAFPLPWLRKLPFGHCLLPREQERDHNLIGHAINAAQVLHSGLAPKGSLFALF